VSASARRRLHQEARQLGFVFVGLDGREHPRYEHTRTGQRVTLPNSVRDCPVRFQNYRARLRHAAGLSSRGRPAVEGQRRHRKRTRRGDPMLTKAAADRAAILARKDRVAAVARRHAELRDVARLMRS
jgi:hypothetical protein